MGQPRKTKTLSGVATEDAIVVNSELNGGDWRLI